MDWEQALATGHVVAASSALLAGAAVLLSPKGTRTHRAIGTGYVVALVLVNVAALSLHREAVFGVFHVLAVASLVTLAVGPDLAWWVVPVVIGTVLSLSGAAIFGKVPPILDRMFAEG